MSKPSKTPRVLANITLWALIAVGLVFHVLVTPTLASDLAAQYTEYAKDGITIGILISTPVALGQVLLFLVFLLLRRVNSDRIFSQAAFKLVGYLIANSYALAASGFAVLAWLAFKNTLPPAILIFGTICILIALAVALVTTSLSGLLKRAADAKHELDEVI